MKEISHRQMRNESAAVLRRVEAGETILVLNSGRPAAVIGPPTGDTVSALAARGQLRAATARPDTLQDIIRGTSSRSTAEIIEDSRGRW
jgi:prevent-host-death family protein